MFSKTNILIDLPYIHEIKKKTSVFITKLEKFKCALWPIDKKADCRSLKNINGNKVVSVKIHKGAFEFLDEALKLDECIKTQKKFQSSLEFLLGRFILENFQKISILLDETVINMKRAVLGNGFENIISNTDHAHISEKSNCLLSLDRSGGIYNNKNRNNSKNFGTENMAEYDDEKCKDSRRHHKKRHDPLDQRFFPGDIFESSYKPVLCGHVLTFIMKAV